MNQQIKKEELVLDILGANFVRSHLSQKVEAYNSNSLLVFNHRVQWSRIPDNLPDNGPRPAFEVGCT